MTDLQIGAEVQAALAAGRPVVALESTVIAHGFPYPDNLILAQDLEAEVRAAGAVPATVCAAGGRLVVGADADLLALLAEPGRATKTSLADLPAVLCRGVLGATTVAATLLAADAAGIGVFVTGGIGGVHRGWQQTADISADLTALGRSRAAVVCAGAKAVLDIPATLEVLETLGVTVLGLGSAEFPGFYCRTTGCKVALAADSPAAAAAVIARRRRLGLAGSALVVVPPPAATAPAQAEVEAWLEQALAEAAAAAITGKAVTPFLLRRLNELSAGRTGRANRALLLHNAAVGAQIAAALAAAAAGS